MSFDTNRTYRYQLNGRKLQLYQYVQSANTDTVAGYRIKLPLDYYANQLIYPNEDITDGLRIEYTSLDEPFITEALEELTASFILFSFCRTYILSNAIMYASLINPTVLSSSDLVVNVHNS